ncbi:MAG: hypothetical protein IKZ82_03240 [Clostridia bacterium]|nr:hypothetical protein [Clostridia bacterium]
MDMYEEYRKADAKKKRRKTVLVFCAVLLVLMLIPIRHKYKDGGTVAWKSILYSVYDMHADAGIEAETGKNLYTVGTRIELLGFTVLDNTHDAPDPEK